MNSSGHPAGVFFCLIARLRPGLGLALAFLGNPCLGFSVALLPGPSAVSFAFIMVTLCFGTSLAPRLAGFTVPARSTRDKSHGKPL